jgi:hypothetical protein
VEIKLHGAATGDVEEIVSFFVRLGSKEAADSASTRKTGSVNAAPPRSRKEVLTGLRAEEDDANSCNTDHLGSLTF